jgi:hypothetical protein
MNVVNKLANVRIFWRHVVPITGHDITATVLAYPVM